MKNTFWLNRKESTVEIYNEEKNGVFTLQELKQTACHRIINCLGGLGIAQCGGCLPIHNDKCVAKYLKTKE